MFVIKGLHTGKYYFVFLKLCFTLYLVLAHN